MPVLEDALLGAAMIFTPILLGLRFGKPLLSAVSQALQRVPRTHYLVDIVLDWLRRDPESSRAVLEGILFGGAAPPPEERQRIEHPALVIGHPNDPLHPFSDADMLVEEMPNARLVDANSIFEWRLTPARLNDELAALPRRGLRRAPAARSASARARRAIWPVRLVSRIRYPGAPDGDPQGGEGAPPGRAARGRAARGGRRRGSA